MNLDIGRLVIEANFAKSGTWGSNDPDKYEAHILSIRIIGRARRKALAIVFLPFRFTIGVKQICL